MLSMIYVQMDGYRDIGLDMVALLSTHS